MSESIKAVCMLFGFVAMVVGGVAWFLDGPDGVMWAMRIGGPLIALAALGVIVGLNSRADLVPDYLGARVGRFFNSGGFCFATEFVVQRGIACLYIWFQNQYDGPCQARVVLRSGRGFWKNPPFFNEIVVDIDCPPAGFGLARLPVPIPLKRQGQQQPLDLGAVVLFPQGKGRRLRFNDGIYVRNDTSLSKKLGLTLTVVGAMAGVGVINTPAKVIHLLPENVAETLPKTIPPQVITYWKLGDPPLQERN